MSSVGDSPGAARGISGPAVRRLVLEQAKRANVGHIGSALSVAEILAVLYSDILQGEPAADDRDRLILSKGHAALALYAALHLAGRLSADDLSTYCADGSLLGVHPEHELEGIDFSTGSLGHGLSLGAGSALASRILGQSNRTFVLLSDAELNEGSVWEAAMFAGHHKLTGLIAIVDDNGQQALGRTEDIVRLRPIEDKWRSLGWATSTINGHDEEQLRRSLSAARAAESGPTLVVAETVCGHGVSYMAGRVEWHYLPMSEMQYQQALQELEQA